MMKTLANPLPCHYVGWAENTEPCKCFKSSQFFYVASKKPIFVSQETT